MSFRKKFHALILMVAIVSIAVSCSGAKFAGSSGKSSGGTTEKPADLPEDVAGGFGLTCSQADNPDDPLAIDYSCTFVTNIGQKFQETADQKVELTVQSGGKDVTFVKQDPTSSSSFKFKALKSEITGVKIAAKVTNPLEGNKIKGAINKALSDVIDTTPPLAPNVTGTSTSTANTTPTWSWSSGGNGGNGMFRYRLNDSNLASGAVEISGTTFTPRAALLEGTHTLYVQERDAAGNWSASGSFAIQVVTPPAAPTLTTLTRSLNSLSLSWAPVTGVTYNLYWAKSAGVTNASSKIPNVVSVYNHMSLSGGTTYYYKLAAVKSGVESALSNEVSAAPYSYPAPTITAISPNSGPTSGGTTVTISGRNFLLQNTKVTIGDTDVPLTEITSMSLKFVTPPAIGTKVVKVTNPDTPTASTSFVYGFQCSGNDDDCYRKAELENVQAGTVIPGPETNSELIYAFANGSNGFKIWRENGGSRFLNASGKVNWGWQKKLESNGNHFVTESSANSSAHTDFTSITGRACPDYVFSSGAARNDQPCVYYTSDLSAPGQDLNISKWNDLSTSEGALVSWFDANSSLCGARGMRLPTAYEVGATQIGGFNFMPSDTAPESPEDVDADKNVPLLSSMLAGVQINKGIWTATGSTRDENNYFALVPAGTGTTPPSNRICASVLFPGERCLMDFPRSDTRFGIRCVLPGF